jgi:hypothetical protein
MMPNLGVTAIDGYHLFRKKRAGKPYGAWYAWLRGQTRHFYTGTQQIEDARSKAVRRLAELEGREPPAAPPPAPAAPPASPYMSGAAGNHSPGANGAPRRDPRAILTAWATGGPPPPAADGSSPAEPAAAAPPPAPRGTLSDEQAEKICAGLAKITAVANAAACGALVRALGRQPGDPSEDEENLTAAGWELQWREWLRDQEPRPWMLIAAGSIGMAAGMYLEGTPLETEKTRKEEGG